MTLAADQTPNTVSMIDRVTLREKTMMSLYRTRLMSIAVAALLLATLDGCACRPGRIGPYGGIHPARCWVW
ncbi:hypothetical protein [Lichenicoccus sp.]|uniref:hypothetical protein n=1 Tax=Lichenicoccus sp. TaxID=2781899 RepID=UPI003D0A0AA9